jgi:ATPase subunit of ABC transporter with duplicated ATPase domains
LVRCVFPGKTTFLELLAAGKASGVTTANEASVGYYRQDFNNFDFEATVMDTLERVSNMNHSPAVLRGTSARFLLAPQTWSQPVKTLSEGQKGLLSLACLFLLAPSVLIMDEPTNHINFRHLPALANAVRSFKGAVILVSHDASFVQAVGCTHVIDMGKELGVTQPIAVAPAPRPANKQVFRAEAAAAAKSSTEKWPEGEYRVDPKDGNWYPIESFISEYGGTAEWEAAKNYDFTA